MVAARRRNKTAFAAACLFACALHGAFAVSQQQLNKIGAAKLIRMFGMKEVDHYSDPALYDEPIMGFEDGARLALFSPKAEGPLQKSMFPVAVIYTPDWVPGGCHLLPGI